MIHRGAPLLVLCGQLVQNQLRRPLHETAFCAVGICHQKRAGKRDPAQQNEVACRCEVPRTHQGHNQIAGEQGFLEGFRRPLFERNGGQNAIGCGEPLHDGEVRPAPFRPVAIFISPFRHLGRDRCRGWSGLPPPSPWRLVHSRTGQCHLYHRAGSPRPHPTVIKRPLRCRR